MNRKQLTLLTLISISVTIAFVLPKVIDHPLFTIKENTIERIERTENILFSASVNVSFIIIE